MVIHSEHAHYITKWHIRHTQLSMHRTHPLLRNFQDNIKLACHCIACYIQNEIDLYSKVHQASLELAQETSYTLTYTIAIIEGSGGLEMLVHVYGTCSSRLHDSIKSLWITQFRYTAKAAFVALKRVLCIIAESPEVPKSKKERTTQLFWIIL